MCDKTIEMFKNEKVEFPKTICSGAMGPCITIGIFDNKNKNGYMRHQPSAEHGNDMENFIIETLTEVSKKDAIVYVSGGAFDKNDKESVTSKSVLISRTHVESIVFKYFRKSQVTIKWIEEDQISELILDTKTGEFSIEITLFN